MIPARTNQAPDSTGEWARMLPRFISTLVKVAVASLIVGTILDHFGLSAGVLLKEVGLTPERVAELARHGLAWAPQRAARRTHHRADLVRGLFVSAAGAA